MTPQESSKDLSRQEYTELMKESVRANVLNAEATKGIHELQKQLYDHMCDLNDNFVLHRNATEQNIEFIKKDLIKWLKACIIVIFSLLGGIVILKPLGLDVVELINNIGK